MDSIQPPCKKGRPKNLARINGFLCRECGTSDPLKFYVYPNGHVKTRRLCKDCKSLLYRTSKRSPSQKRGDPPLCRDCGESRLSEFYIYPNGRINRFCRKCVYAHDVEHREQERKQAEQWVQTQVVPYPRQQMPMYMYDALTKEDVALLIFVQGGLCKICQQPLVMDKRNGYHTDHDHVTGLVRGVLCFRCNTGIGHLRDDPTILRKAADYLEAHNEGYLEARGWTKRSRKRRMS